MTARRFARMGHYSAKPVGRGKAIEVGPDDKPVLDSVDKNDPPGRLPSQTELALANSLGPKGGKKGNNANVGPCVDRVTK